MDMQVRGKSVVYLAFSCLDLPQLDCPYRNGVGKMWAETTESQLG